MRFLEIRHKCNINLFRNQTEISWIVQTQTYQTEQSQEIKRKCELAKLGYIQPSLIHVYTLLSIHLPYRITFQRQLRSEARIFSTVRSICQRLLE